MIVKIAGHARVLACILAALSANEVLATHIGVVDQHQDALPAGGQAFIGYGNWVGGYKESSQTFRVGVNGGLTGLDLMLTPWNVGSSHVFAEIRPTDEFGFPLGSDAAVLATGSLNIPSNALTFYSIEFAAPYLQVQAGDLLAIVLRTNAEAGLSWKGSEGDLYPQGGTYYRIFTNASKKGNWVASLTPDYDAVFRTYVIAVPEPYGVSALLGGMALLLCARRCAAWGR